MAQYPIQKAPNWGNPRSYDDDFIDMTSGAAGTMNPGRFAFLRNLFSRMPKNFGELHSLGNKIRGTQILGGPTVATAANTIGGIYQGVNAAKGIYDNVQSDEDLRSLKNDISSSIAANPMYDMYLDASDEKLLRQMNNGTITDNVNDVGNGIVQGIPKALLQAGLGYLTGGPVGAGIGGIGSLINSGIQGYGQGNEKASSKLQGLYNKLKQAEEEYRTMRRPSGLSSAGLQTRYFNQLY